MVFRGPWEPEIQYNLDDVVEYETKSKGVLYFEIVQPHKSQVYFRTELRTRKLTCPFKTSWTPDIVPAI